MKKDNYLINRKKLEKKWVKNRKLFDLIDHWPIYVGKKNLARFLFLFDLAKNIKNIKGDICEFGSWKGANVFFISKIIEIIDKKSKKKIHAFESFKGMDGTGNKSSKSKYDKHNYIGSEIEFYEFRKLYNLKRLNLVKGKIEKTVNIFLKKNKKFSLLYHDIHFYEPTKFILDKFHSHLQVGGYFCFDDWNLIGGDGETKAVNEFIKKFKKKYEIIYPDYTEQPSIILKKIKD